MLLLKAIQNTATHYGATYLGLAIGKGTTAVSISDNALVTESQRVATINTIATTTNANDTSVHTGDFTITSGGAGAITEAGVPTTSTTGGDFAARQVFSALNFVENDNVIFVFKFVTSG
jgi:hypothetical protein